MHLASRMEQEEETVLAANRYAALRDFDGNGLLNAMEAVASLPSPGRSAKALLAQLLARTRLFISTASSPEGSESAKYRRFFAPYCAARAHLSSAPRERCTWWRRAVEQDAKNTSYLRHYADALEASGLGQEAEKMRKRADLFNPGERGL